MSVIKIYQEQTVLVYLAITALHTLGYCHMEWLWLSLLAYSCFPYPCAAMNGWNHCTHSCRALCYCPPGACQSRPTVHHVHMAAMLLIIYSAR